MDNGKISTEMLAQMLNWVENGMCYFDDPKGKYYHSPKSPYYKDINHAGWYPVESDEALEAFTIIIQQQLNAEIEFNDRGMYVRKVKIFTMSSMFGKPDYETRKHRKQ